MAQQQAETVYDRIEQNGGIDVNAGIDALRQMAKLLREKRKDITALKRSNVALEAKFGSSGQDGTVAEKRRKVKLAELELKHLELALKPPPGAEGGAGRKPSDETLKRLAHADPQYVAFLDQLTSERAQYLTYKEQLSELYDDVEHIKGGIDRLTIRMRMDEEAIRMLRAEANLAR